MSDLNESEDSDEDAFPEMGMGALSAETLALLVDFLPNRRFEDVGTDDGRVGEGQACVAYTSGDAMQIAATLKRLAQQHEEKEALEREEGKHIVRILPPPPTELLPSTPGEDAYQTLTDDGVCRMNGILPPELCDRVLAQINHLLAAELAACNPQERETGFGNVLCRESRWDMYLRNEGVYQEALAGMLGERSGPLSTLFHRLFEGDEEEKNEKDEVAKMDRYADPKDVHHVAGTPHNVMNRCGNPLPQPPIDSSVMTAR